MPKKQQPIEQDAEPKMSPDPVDGNELLDAINSEIKRFVILDDPKRHICATYVVYTYLVDEFDVAPKLYISATAHDQGKSSFEKALCRLVFNPIRRNKATTASLRREMDRKKGTYMLDEADKYIVGNPEFQGMLNNSFERDAGETSSSEQVGRKWVTITYSAFCPQIIIGIKLHRLLVDLRSRGHMILIKPKLENE